MSIKCVTMIVAVAPDDVVFAVACDVLIVSALRSNRLIASLRMRTDRNKHWRNLDEETVHILDTRVVAPNCSTGLRVASGLLSVPALLLGGCQRNDRLRSGCSNIRECEGRFSASPC